MRCRNFKNNKWKYRNIVFQENYAIKKKSDRAKKNLKIYLSSCASF